MGRKRNFPPPLDGYFERGLISYDQGAAGQRFFSLAHDAAKEARAVSGRRASRARPDGLALKPIEGVANARQQYEACRQALGHVLETYLIEVVINGRKAAEVDREMSSTQNFQFLKKALATLVLHFSGELVRKTIA